MKPPNRNQHEREAGFSLVEVLVALALSTFVVGAFQLVLMELVQTLEAAEERTRAIAHATSTLAALGGHLPLVEGEAVGSYGKDMSYSLKILADDGRRFASGRQLYEVTLSVEWLSIDGPQRADFLTHRIGGTP